MQIQVRTPPDVSDFTALDWCLLGAVLLYLIAWAVLLFKS